MVDQPEKNQNRKKQMSSSMRILNTGVKAYSRMFSAYKRWSGGEGQQQGFKNVTQEQKISTKIRRLLCGAGLHMKHNAEIPTEAK